MVNPKCVSGGKSACLAGDIFARMRETEAGTGMRAYIIKRLLMMPITLIGVTALVFCLTRMVPGGPVDRILQEQAIGALAGDKASMSATPNALQDEDMERLEELFNLQEPLWKAYLQWLGLRRCQVETVKEDFDRDGCAYLSLSGVEGKERILEVRREGYAPVFLKPDWFDREHWKIRIESPQDRARAWARRTRPADPAAEAERAKYLRWRVVLYRKALNGLLQGNLGKSYKYNESVLKMMAARLPVSLYFGLLGALVAYAVSIPLGVFKALKHKSIFDSLSSLLLFVGYAMPGFALGAVLLVYLGARLEYFPLYGLTGPDFSTLSLLDQIKDLAMHTVLPLTCYVIGALAMTTMMMKNSLLENLSADYMRTAVAKGLSYHRAVWGHAFRNSFIPIASTLGGVVCSVVGGSILIERVFDIQGFGMLSYQALMDKDYSLIMGTLLLSSIMIIMGNLLSDILVAALDPRIKYD